MGAPIKADSGNLARKKHQISMTFHHSSRQTEESHGSKKSKIRPTVSGSGGWIASHNKPSTQQEIS